GSRRGRGAARFSYRARRGAPLDLVARIHLNLLSISPIAPTAKPSRSGRTCTARPGRKPYCGEEVDRTTEANFITTDGNAALHAGWLRSARRRRTQLHAAFDIAGNGGQSVAST